MLTPLSLPVPKVTSRGHSWIGLSVMPLEFTFQTSCKITSQTTSSMTIDLKVVCSIGTSSRSYPSFNPPPSTPYRNPAHHMDQHPMDFAHTPTKNNPPQTSKINTEFYLTILPQLLMALISHHFLS